MDKELRELLERGVAAVELLAQDPIIEIEAAPPICPHCNRMNPTVIVEKDSDGPLGECVLQARCGDCGRNFFAVPVTWHMHTSLDSVKQEMDERAELQNGANQG